MSEPINILSYAPQPDGSAVSWVRSLDPMTLPMHKVGNKGRPYRFESAGPPYWVCPSPPKPSPVVCIAILLVDGRVLFVPWTEEDRVQTHTWKPYKNTPPLVEAVGVCPIGPGERLLILSSSGRVLGYPVPSAWFAPDTTGKAATPKPRQTITLPAGDRAVAIDRCPDKAVGRVLVASGQRGVLVNLTSIPPFRSGRGTRVIDPIDQDAASVSFLPYEPVIDDGYEPHPPPLAIHVLTRDGYGYRYRAREQRDLQKKGGQGLLLLDSHLPNRVAAALLCDGDLNDPIVVSTRRGRVLRLDSDRFTDRKRPALGNELIGPRRRRGDRCGRRADAAA